MPIYEFKCQDCNAVFETIVSSAKAVDGVKCKQCNSSNIQKTISAAANYRGTTGSAATPGASGCCPKKSGFS